MTIEGATERGRRFARIENRPHKGALVVDRESDDAGLFDDSVRPVVCGQGELAHAAAFNLNGALDDRRRIRPDVRGAVLVLGQRLLPSLWAVVIVRISAGDCKVAPHVTFLSRAVEPQGLRDR